MQGYIVSIARGIAGHPAVETAGFQLRSFTTQFERWSGQLCLNKKVDAV